MSHRVSRRTVLGTIGSGTLATITAGCIGDGETSYPDEPIEFETPNPPGGGSDTYVRALSPALSSEFGVDVNPINRTPAEQTIPELYQGGDDGYNVIHFNPTIHAWQIVEDGTDIPFNPAQWQSLGAPNTSSLTLVASTDSGLESWDELVDRSEEGEEFRAALIGQGLGMYYEFIEDNSPVNFEMISGFEGTGDIIGELERGNVEFYIAPAASLLPYTADGICHPILTGEPDIVGEYLLNEYEEIGHEGIASTTYEEADLGDLATLVTSIRICLAPPNVSEDRVEILREGFWDAITGEEFEEQADENNIPINEINAEDSQELLEEKADILANL